MTDARLVVVIDARPAEEGARRAGQAMSGLESGARKVDGAFTRMTKAVFGLRGVAAGLVQAARRSIDYANTIGVVADSLGVGVEALQEFRFAAEDSSNVLSTQADAALQQFTRRVAEAARGTGELQEVFEQYDIAVSSLDGSARAVNEVLAEYADVVQNAESSQEQLRLAIRAFGSEGAALVNLLREGAIGWDEYVQAARDAGILTTDQIRQAQELDSQMKAVEQTLRTDLTQAFLDAGPAISAFVTLTGSVARGLASVARNVAETLRLFGLLDIAAQAPEIRELLSLVNEIDRTGALNLVDQNRPEGGYGTLLDREGALANLRENEEFGSRLIEAEASGDVTAIRDVVQEYIDARNALGSVMIDLENGTGDGSSGGGAGGQSGSDIVAQLDTQTAAIGRQIAALSDLDAGSDIYNATLRDMQAAFAEAGIPFEEFRTEAELSANLFAINTRQLENMEQAMGLINDAIGELPPSAEVARLALDNFALVAEALGLDADQTREALQRLNDELDGENVNSALVDMEELGQQAGQTIANGLERAITQAESLEEALAGVLESLAQIVLQQAVLGPLGNLIGNAIGDDFFGLFSQHQGGLAGSGPIVPASPLSLIGAPRYHGGGIVGLAPDEVPSILQRGEEVLTTRDPRHRSNGGGAGGGISISQYISIDAKAVNENGVDPAAADAAGRQMRQAVRSAVQQELAQQSRVGGMLNKV